MWTTPIRRIMAFVLVSSLAAFAGSRNGDKSDKKDKPAPVAVQNIDSGSLGIFIKGQRVATETFSVEQKNGESIIKSQLKETSGSDPATQKSNLEITASGDLIRYEWNQSAGGSLSVVPNNDFLLEKISTATSPKPAEQPFLMPSTSAILDNNFFVHRQILAWRFLAADCKPEGGNLKCQQDPGDFGVLVPQDRTSMHVRMELVGKEKIAIRGTDRELLRLNLTGENFSWALWLDGNDHFKLIRVEIPADNTEVVRD